MLIKRAGIPSVRENGCLYLVAADNMDGNHVVVLVNSANYKRQAQYYYEGQWWYIEMMPNSVSTLYFEK